MIPVLVACCVGCGTCENHSGIPRVYGGVRSDVKTVTWLATTTNKSASASTRAMGTMWSFIDLPFSAVADTLLLPRDCYVAAHSKSPLTPSEGWKHLRSRDPAKLDSAIRNDYQTYIDRLAAKKRKGLGSINFFEDGRGNQAVTIEVTVDRTRWTHVLIYDQYNQRVKNTKFMSAVFGNC